MSAEEFLHDGKWVLENRGLAFYACLQCGKADVL